ncbi:MAG TPA: hypothetical protein VHE78_15470 [Gemmatimonadaceae bacterium]|nr:hypothetical protein [Gemmatimonadaceae bacterium]
MRRVDHTPEDGRIVALWAAGGGLFWAGVAVLTGGAHDRVSAAMAAMMAGGAVGGIFFAERYLTPSGDRRTALSRIQVDGVGALAALSGVPGNHSFLRWTF